MLSPLTFACGNTKAISESFSEETYTDDDTSGFLADSNHPLIAGQAGNALGRYKRVFVKHAVIRQVGGSSLVGGLDRVSMRRLGSSGQVVFHGPQRWLIGAES